MSKAENVFWTLVIVGPLCILLALFCAGLFYSGYGIGEENARRECREMPR